MSRWVFPIHPLMHLFVYLFSELANGRQWAAGWVGREEGEGKGKGSSNVRTKRGCILPGLAVCSGWRQKQRCKDGKKDVSSRTLDGEGSGLQ